MVFIINDPEFGKSSCLYKGEGICIPSNHEDTISGVVLEGNSSVRPFQSDADSLLKKWEQEELEQKRKELAKNEAKKQELFKKYGQKFAQGIIDGKVLVGMSKEMCKEAMGTPDETTKNTSNLGVIEVWTYSLGYRMFDGLVPITVVTFLDNKVTSVDEYSSWPY